MPITFEGLKTQKEMCWVMIGKWAKVLTGDIIFVLASGCQVCIKLFSIYFVAFLLRTTNFEDWNDDKGKLSEVP